MFEAEVVSGDDGGERYRSSNMRVYPKIEKVFNADVEDVKAIVNSSREEIADQMEDSGFKM